MKPTFPPRFQQWRPGQPLEQPPLPFWLRQEIASTPSPQDIVLAQRLVNQGQTEMASLMAQELLRGMTRVERVENPALTAYLTGVGNLRSIPMPLRPVLSLRLYRDAMFRTYGLTEPEVMKLEVSIR